MEKTRMTVQEYQSLPESSLPTELIDGELIVSPAPLDPHQKASWSIVVYLGSLKLAGTFRHASTDVYIGSDVVQPDIFWIHDDSPDCIQQNKRWYGAPDLIIEILSPSTAHRDRSKKYTIYEQHGVREYWLIDPEALFVEVYTRSSDHFARHGVFGIGETFQSPVLAIEIEVSTLLGV